MKYTYSFIFITPTDKILLGVNSGNSIEIPSIDLTDKSTPEEVLKMYFSNIRPRTKCYEVVNKKTSTGSKNLFVCFVANNRYVECPEVSEKYDFFDVFDESGYGHQYFSHATKNILDRHIKGKINRYSDILFK